MDALSWYEWLTKVVRADLDLRSTGVMRVPTRDELLMVGQSWRLWPALGSVRTLLEDLWTQYQPVGAEWKRNVRVDPSAVDTISRAVRLLAARVGAVNLDIYLVQYPSVVGHPVGPSAMVVGEGDLPLGVQMLQDNIMNMAMELLRVQG